ncbi:hypothetical protein SMICM304S_10360 [Streptomyces microflavus]
MRWQRLRSRSEREALELGHEPRGAVHWPVLTAYVVDAVWAAYSAVLAGHGAGPDATPADRGRPANPDATPADRALPQVTRIDLATLATATFPVLPEPLCPACVSEVPDTAEAARMDLAPAPKPDPDGYRLRTLDSYPLPTAALANPVCGALGSDTWINPASTTTAPVAGTHFVRGYAGLNDVTWSGQANRYATSRTLAYLEGLERYAGTHRRRGTSPVVDSYANLAGQALNPADCGFYAPETYASDPLRSPFDPDRAIPWVWGHLLLRDDRPVLVPARLAHYSAGRRRRQLRLRMLQRLCDGGTVWRRRSSSASSNWSSGTPSCSPGTAAPASPRSTSPPRPPPPSAPCSTPGRPARLRRRAGRPSMRGWSIARRRHRPRGRGGHAATPHADRRARS